jgi:parkin
MGECGKGNDARPTGSVASSSYPAIVSEMAARAQWEDATRRTIKILTKPCPKCRVPTQRDGGMQTNLLINL